MSRFAFDPRQVPLESGVDHGPAIPHDALSAAALRQRFEEVRPWTPDSAGDERQMPGREARPASVLLPLRVGADARLQVVLTQRTAHLHDHAGQISFPGGRQDPQDADPIATALREAQEEVGLHPDTVEVLGCLPLYTTSTRYHVTPVVALVHSALQGPHDPFEVDHVFEVPLEFLMNPQHHQRHIWRDAPATAQRFWSMPWSSPSQAEPYFIWGATAGILRNFYRFLRA